MAGLPVLFDAIALLKKGYPDLHLSLMGLGSERAVLDAQLQKIDITGIVSFSEIISHDHMVHSLQVSDLFVPTSLE